VIPLSFADIAALTGGRLADVPDPAARVTGPVVVDSRAVEPGALFVALPGERVDGHDFAAQAVQAGAMGVLASRATGVPSVLVPDAVAALGALARGMLTRLPELAVIGVTGSSGKTSTKDLLADVLATHGSTVAARGSHNNEIGLPLTVLSATADTRYLVLEMAARGVGHIAYLTELAPPRIGVVLNVGSAHIGEFGGREGIARAKGELVEALPAAGLAVLNADDPLVRAMASRTAARVRTFGVADQADVRARDVRLDAAARASFTLVCASGSAPVRLGLHGEHHVGNALAAACVALELGMPLPAVADALGRARPRSRWRMEVRERADGVTVINDAFNANPESMRAALKALVAMAGGGRTWAVLGEMLELGPEADAAHDEIGRLAVRLNVSRLVVVGSGAARIHAGASLEGSWGRESVFVPDIPAALELLRAELRAGDVVLVKSSKGAGLSALGEALVEESGANERGAAEARR
jgi:UDP-N-acetylmuramoyl-tripeptide--D-alanyl-D-alanine ligase